MEYLSEPFKCYNIEINFLSNNFKSGGFIRLIKNNLEKKYFLELSFSNSIYNKQVKFIDKYYSVYFKVLRKLKFNSKMTATELLFSKTKIGY